MNTMTRNLLIGTGVLVVGASGVLVLRKNAQAKEAPPTPSTPPTPQTQTQTPSTLPSGGLTSDTAAPGVSYWGKSGGALETYKAEALGHKNWFVKTPDWKSEDGVVNRAMAQKLGYKAPIVLIETDGGTSVITWRRSDAAKKLFALYAAALQDPNTFTSASLDDQRAILASGDPKALYTKYAQTNQSPPAVLTGALLEELDLILSLFAKGQVNGDFSEFADRNWWAWTEDKRARYLTLATQSLAKG